MIIGPDDCCGNNCVVCHAWSPKKSQRQKLVRGWNSHLPEPESFDPTPGFEAQRLDYQTLLHGLQDEPKPSFALVEIPNTAAELMMHCMGYTDENLVHQLEARALKEGAHLSQTEWHALAPYMILDEEGVFSYEQRGVLQGKIDFRTTKLFVEIWHGHHGVLNALRLRRQALIMHSTLEYILPKNERRALKLLHQTVAEQPDRILVNGDGGLVVKGDSGLTWLIQPNGSSRGVPKVQCQETSQVFCIQPDFCQAELPSADYTAVYVLAMINDIATSFRVSTLSNGLKKELKKANSIVGVGGFPTLDQGGEPFQRILS